METHIRKFMVHSISPLVSSLACLILLPMPASSQNGDAAKVRVQEMDKRELQLRGLGKDGKNPNDTREAQAIRAQVGEDFERILKLHNEIVRTIAADSSFNYGFISNATGEIKKRAMRLQATLGLHKPEPDQNPLQKQDLDATRTKEGMIVLCTKIESFMKNPIIDSPGTVSAELLEKARRDLQSVIELSAAIKKGADRQKKP